MTITRPYVPLKVKLDAALIQLGLDPKTTQLDHRPALARRERTEDGGYIPDANDPRYLEWVDPDEHKRRTFGNGATTRGSDIGEIAKTRRLTLNQEAVRRRMLAKEPGNPPPKSGKIRSRKFQTRQQPSRGKR